MTEEIMNNLQGRVVIITGAAGGLGNALARRFAREGCRLFLTDQHEDRLKAIMAELAGEGVTVAGKTADLMSVSQTEEIIESVCKTYGQIDILVNNAGISRAKAFWDLTEEDWDQMFDVNAKALFFATRTAAKHMLAGGGSIINIASVAGRLPRPTLMHYAASKAAVISITRSAALALAGNKIRVNAIAPGMMDTEMFHILSSDLEQASSGSAAGKPNLSIIPLGRIAQPEEIAASAIFLAGDAAAYITGQTLNVCGGICMS
jgi:NAD(P)-dependent dehydrogenase (short-subunit alcohol dehydrogenase family)